MGNNNLNSKVESALESVVDGLSLSGVTTNAGGTQDDLAAPYVVCSCPSGGVEPENLHGTGIYMMTARVTTASQLDDVTNMATHDARVQSVNDALRDSSISGTLTSSVDDFHVYQVIFTGEDREIEERKVSDTLEMEITCCGGDIS